MASIDSLISDNKKYETLKTQLRTTSDRLYKAIVDAGKISSTLDKNYTLNNNSVAATGQVSNLVNYLSGLREKILITVIPAIDNQIALNEAEIARIEAEEERERREAEERARASESALARQSRRS